MHVQFLSPTLNLNIRHNHLARIIIYQEITGIDKIEIKPTPLTHKNKLKFDGMNEYSYKPFAKTENNRPGIVIWHTEKRLCRKVEIIVPLDVNLKSIKRQA